MTPTTSEVEQKEVQAGNLPEECVQCPEKQTVVGFRFFCFFVLNTEVMLFLHFRIKHGRNDLSRQL